MKTFETSNQRKIRIAIIESIEEVIDVPREYWEVKRTAKSNEVMIRQIYIYLLYKYSNHTLQFIADITGLKNHTTILRNLRSVEGWFESPEENEEQLSIINKTIELYEQRINNNTEASVG